MDDTTIYMEECENSELINEGNSLERSGKICGLACYGTGKRCGTGCGPVKGTHCGIGC